MTSGHQRLCPRVALAVALTFERPWPPDHQPEPTPRVSTCCGALLDLVALRSQKPLGCCWACRYACIRGCPTVANANLSYVVVVFLAPIQKPDCDLGLAAADSDLRPAFVVDNCFCKRLALIQGSVA